MKGVIAKLFPDKGFGFIRAVDSGIEYFFHTTSLDKGEKFHSLKEGQNVEFHAQESSRGPRAGVVKSET